MLAGVLLHQIEPALIINDALNLRADNQRAVAQVDNGFALLPHILHPDTAQCA